jgi:DNA-binding XRE family transcriptional regulator
MKPSPKGQRAHLDARVKLFLQLLGELINARRLELKMSQATVAEMAGLSRTAVYNIEHGLVDERATTLMRLTWALKMSYAGMVATLEHLMQHPEHRPLKRGLKTLRGKKAKGQV